VSPLTLLNPPYTARSLKFAGLQECLGAGTDRSQSLGLTARAQEADETEARLRAELSALDSEVQKLTELTRAKSERMREQEEKIAALEREVAALP
jgi:predicted  nucleic acid-binding Zn-ribbon protein